MSKNTVRTTLYLTVILGGMCGLSWELIWQSHSALALGVSAYATAFILAATMGGMTAGTLVCGACMSKISHRLPPLRLYGLLEIIIGIFGLLLPIEFSIVGSIDRWLFIQGIPFLEVTQLLFLTITISPPATAMGATVPLFGLLAKEVTSNLSMLYGLNILGSAFGILLIAFLVLPVIGLLNTSLLVAGVNICIGFTLWWIADSTKLSVVQQTEDIKRKSLRSGHYLSSFLSGFTVFALEVIWFRAMRSAFLSTAQSFAVMLTAVLLPLAVSAHGVRIFQRLKIKPAILFVSGGILTLITAPMIERLDMLSATYAIDRNLSKFFLTLSIVGPVTVVLGGVFPQLIEEANNTRDWSRIHAVNTLGAILGAMTTAWLALPLIGLSGSMLMISVLLFVVGYSDGGTKGITKRNSLISLIVIFLMVAINARIMTTTHIIGAKSSGLSTYSVVEHRDTPDYSIAVLEYDNKRALFIDGFSASADLGDSDYMTWMGRLPMLMHPDPLNALVICFGRGVTADTVRNEGISHLDIVDISNTVFEMGQFFTYDNHNILKDPKINAISMDGRAWLRRANTLYDVITLEPMPPTFSGVNNLYSEEFYELARDRLTREGTLAQWLPFHLLTPEQSQAISKTFTKVFPNSILWLFEPYHTGILVGRKENSQDIKFFRLHEKPDTRELTPKEIEESIKLRRGEILKFAGDAPIITDDNQYLSFSWESVRNDLSYKDSTTYESIVFQLIHNAQRKVK